MRSSIGARGASERSKPGLLHPTVASQRFARSRCPLTGATALAKPTFERGPQPRRPARALSWWERQTRPAVERLALWLVGGRLRERRRPTSPTRPADFRAPTSHDDCRASRAEARILCLARKQFSAAVTPTAPCQSGAPARGGGSGCERGKQRAEWKRERGENYDCGGRVRRRVRARAGLRASGNSFGCGEWPTEERKASESFACAAQTPSCFAPLSACGCPATAAS